MAMVLPDAFLPSVFLQLLSMMEMKGEMEMGLPYSNSSADPMKAQGRIQVILRKFGIQRILFDDDVENHTITIFFKCKDLPVKIPVNYKDLAAKFLEQEPYNSYRRCKEADYVFKLNEKAYKASYSMLEDLIKSMISIVNLGAFSFEEIFLGFFVGKDGRTVSEVMVPQLGGFRGAGFQLTEGK